MFDIILEPPDFFSAGSPDFHAWQDETVWYFPGSPDSIAALLRTAGLDEEQVARWTDSSHLRTVPKGVEIRPEPEEILALTPQMRSRLYPMIRIAGRPTNLYRRPMPLKMGGIERMAGKDSGVSPESIELNRRLTWRKGHFDVFSDLALVMRQAKGDAERFRIHKTLMRELAVMASLMLSDRSDLAALTGYWSAGGRNRDLQPLLESIFETPGVERIDAAQLLPPVPRKLLNTFSNPNMAVGDNLPDCFSTALSFFSDEMGERFFDSISPALSERYDRATKPWQFGDVIMIFETGNVESFVHACNYVADDLVFTKNGQGFGRPWKLATLGSVLSDYRVADNMSANFFRLKPEYRR